MGFLILFFFFQLLLFFDMCDTCSEFGDVYGDTSLALGWVLKARLSCFDSYFLLFLLLCRVVVFEAELFFL